MKKNKKLIAGVLVVVIIGLLVWYFMRQKEDEEQIDPSLRTSLTGNGNGAPTPPSDPATPSSTNPCDNMISWLGCTISSMRVLGQTEIVCQ